MPASGWARVDGWMRSLHLYTGLFLVPWMAVYATSALFLNHDAWLGQKLGVPLQQWNVVREEPLAADDSFPREPADQARAVLRKLDLDGYHSVLGDPNAKELVIYRRCAGGDYRVTWRREQGRVVVQRLLPVSALRWMHSLHFGRGYDWRYPTSVLWAFSVDFVVASTWFWLISGVYIWARRPKKRALGAVCLAAGILLFAVLAVLLSR